MAREMDEIVRQQIAQPANSCITQDGVSFLDRVILPLYDVIDAVSLCMFYNYSTNFTNKKPYVLKIFVNLIKVLTVDSAEEPKTERLMFDFFTFFIKEQN